MIHSSELHKISKGHSQERHFFLFDNQLIYCKKVTTALAIGPHLSEDLLGGVGGRLNLEGGNLSAPPSVCNSAFSIFANSS